MAVPMHASKARQIGRSLCTVKGTLSPSGSSASLELKDGVSKNIISQGCRPRTEEEGQECPSSYWQGRPGICFEAGRLACAHGH